MNKTKIKIYSDKSYLPAQTAHVILLYPFWGINPESLESYPSAYERYAQIGSDFFEMTRYSDYVLCMLFITTGLFRQFLSPF